MCSGLCTKRFAVHALTLHYLHCLHSLFWFLQLCQWGFILFFLLCWWQLVILELFTIWKTLLSWIIAFTEELLNNQYEGLNFPTENTDWRHYLKTALAIVLLLGQTGEVYSDTWIKITLKSLETPRVFCKGTEPGREVDGLAVTLLNAHIHNASRTGQEGTLLASTETQNWIVQIVMI